MKPLETDRGRIINRNRWRFRLAYAVASVAQALRDVAGHIDSDGAICVITDSIRRSIKRLERESSERAS